VTIYDRLASSFDRQRPLPEDVPNAIRRAVLGVDLPPRPRLLDLGAGSGRIGRPFVEAGDDVNYLQLNLDEWAGIGKVPIPTRCEQIRLKCQMKKPPL
jgi:hypothetical protein